ncbi:hypothetical protein AMECASPLE_016486 [Ameca splendens]|uniref:Uncharacterized protein n=1 Tax=Ameca splendens TaxID=208324 RepID=A0ABV0XR51_9TELE
MHSRPLFFLCVYQPDALNISLLINTKRDGGRDGETQEWRRGRRTKQNESISISISLNFDHLSFPACTSCDKAQHNGATCCPWQEEESPK